MSCVTNTTVRGRSASVATSSRRIRVAGLVVERAERLVHQQDVGLGGERARELDALAHAARQLVRVVAGELGEPRDLEPLVDLLRAGRRRGVARQAALDVLAHGQPREQPAVLVDRAALAGALDGAARRREVAAEQREQRRLAAARRADADERARRARPRGRGRRSRRAGRSRSRRPSSVEDRCRAHRSNPQRSARDPRRAARTATSRPMPIAPIVIMPHTTRSMRRPLRASMIR